MLQKRVVFYVCVFLLAVFVLSLFWVFVKKPDYQQDTVMQPDTNIVLSDAVVNFGKVSVNVEIADTPQKRARGLSGREKMGDLEGMLFVSKVSSYPTFWMKNMRFPLDFIWINGNQIIDITKNVKNPDTDTPDDQLLLYKPKNLVDKVLEVNAGFTEKYNINIGDQVEVVNNKNSN